MKKSSRIKSKAGRRAVAAVSGNSKASASPSPKRFVVSKRDAAGKVTITDRQSGGRSVVPWNMANLIVRAAGELSTAPASAGRGGKSAASKPDGDKSAAVKIGAAKAGVRTAKGSAAATPPSAPTEPEVVGQPAAKGGGKRGPKNGTKSGAKRRTKAGKAKSFKVKAPSTARGGVQASSANGGVAAPASSGVPGVDASAKKEDASKPAAGISKGVKARKAAGKVAARAAKKKAKKTKAVKKASAPTQVVGGVVTEVVKRGPGRPSNAELAGQRIVHPQQTAAKMPKEIREFNPKFENKATGAVLSRRFFSEQKKWGYEVQIRGEHVGQMLFDYARQWVLTPTDGRLVERGVKTTEHVSPISAFIRVTNGWSLALSGESDVPVKIGKEPAVA